MRKKEKTSGEKASCFDFWGLIIDWGEFRVVISPCLNISVGSLSYKGRWGVTAGYLAAQGPVGPQPLLDEHIIYFASSNTHCDTEDQDQNEDVSLFRDVYGW